MGPVEITFLVLLAIWAFVGVVRGFHRELGVTTMLLIGLFVLEVLNERYQSLVENALNVITGQPTIGAARAWIYVIALLIMAFISYQGQTLVFPGNRSNTFFSIGTGFINGYLLWGSIWYYLQQAGWPGLPISPPFTQAYQLMVRLLPPAVFSWPYFIGLAVILLIARVWK